MATTENKKQNHTVSPQQGRGVTDAATDRNKRELTCNLSETHRIITAVQFGDRSALLIRKRMSFNEEGPMPATKAMDLLSSYNSAVDIYFAAVDAMCSATGLDRVKQPKPAKPAAKKPAAKK